MESYAIAGMTCQHCVRTVQGALAKLPGVSHVTVDLPGGLATFEGAASEEVVVATLRDEGYEARRIAARG